MSLLRLSNVAAFYGSAQALFDVSFTVAEGELVALLGRNGMGKTTIIRTICQMMKAQDGEIQFHGHDLRALPSHKAARLGIGLVPEGRRCFADLSVEENLLAAARPGPWNFDRIVELFPHFVKQRQQLAGSLSGGEQQMLAIGRALMTNPRLLMLDEATEGLAPVVRQEIWAVIARLKTETGMAILVIDKSLRKLSQIADRAVILTRGKTVWTGGFDELTTEMIDQHLGV